MKKVISLSALTLSVFLAVFSVGVFAEGAEVVVRDIKVDGGEHSELDVKKAIIYTRLHYNWKMTEHSRSSMTLEYRDSIIRLDIDGANIKIVSLTPDIELGSKWLPRFEKLYLRRLAYGADTREAKSFIK